MNNNNSELVLENFSVSANGGKSPLVSASTRIPQCRLHTLIGPNGAGKSSLLRGMLGILRTNGALLLGEQNLSSLPTHKRTNFLAYQPQSPPRGEGLRVDEFVASARGAHSPWLTGFSNNDKQVCETSLARVGASHLSERILSTLSGGEIARVNLASTLALGTQWLLLDEPVAAADVSAARDIYRLLKSLVREEGLSIFVVEHDLGLARTWADEVSVIASGELVASENTAEVFASDALSRAYATTFKQVEVVPGTWAVVAVNGDENKENAS